MQKIIRNIFVTTTLFVFSIPKLAIAACDPSTTTSPAFCSMFCSGGTCANYNAWMSGLWNWGLAIIIPLSVLMIAIAGIFYTTSSGNPDKISMAKKIFFGVLSGLGILILSKLLLTVIGVN
jgi:hypothetical protein